MAPHFRSGITSLNCNITQCVDISQHNYIKKNIPQTQKDDQNRNEEIQHGSHTHEKLRTWMRDIM